MGGGGVWGSWIFLLTSLKRGGNYVAFFFNTNWKNALKLKKSSNKFGLAHTWPKNDQKLMCTYSLGQNTWDKITKFSKSIKNGFMTKHSIYLLNSAYMN